MQSGTNALHDNRHAFHWKTWLALATTIILWGSAFVGIRAGLSAFAPGELALLRYLMASVAMGIMLRWGPTTRPRPNDLVWFAVAGVVGIAAYNIFLSTGELRVTAASASFVMNMSPVFTALLAMLALKERLNIVGWLGMALSFSGAGVIIIGEGGGFHWQPAVLLVLLAAFAQSIQFVVTKPLISRYGPLQVTAFAVWIGTACLLFYLPGLGHQLTHAPLGITASVLYLGIFPAAIGYACWSYAVSRMPVSSTATALYLVPLATMLIGWIWIHELPPGLSVVGGALAISGVVLVNRYGRGQLGAERTKQASAYSRNS